MPSSSLRRCLGIFTCVLNIPHIRAVDTRGHSVLGKAIASCVSAAVTCRAARIRQPFCGLEFEARCLVLIATQTTLP